jgi:predicted dehydrogenase
MAAEPIRVGIVGCGSIAGPYARDLATYPEVALVGVTDLERGRATELAAEVGCAVFDDLATMLADPGVDLVTNLTSHAAHYRVTRSALDAGKHVYSEKPLALRAAEAAELVELADARGVRLGCSPFTFLGEAQQAAWRAIESGQLGTVRVVYAEVNWGRIETWHPEPSSFYDVGPLFDVGVYPLTLLTAFFGPARSVHGYGRVLQPDRLTKRGEPFRVTTPDFVMAAVELESGVLVRLTTTFYVSQRSRQTGIEFHGDAASLHLASWQHPDSTLAVAPYGRDYARAAEQVASMEWGRGVRDLVESIQHDRPHRVTGEHASHVVEILCAVATSVAEGRAVAVSSTFTPPRPLDVAVPS